MTDQPAQSAPSAEHVRLSFATWMASRSNISHDEYAIVTKWLGGYESREIASGFTSPQHQEAAALRTAQLRDEIFNELFQVYESTVANLKARAETAESALSEARERTQELEDFLRKVQEYDCPKQCNQKKNHHTAFCTNTRALLTSSASGAAQDSE